MIYQREKAVAYARKWAFRRNPRFYSFDEIGGDCTNFVSQCIYAGAGVMNYTRDTGWYYISVNNRAPAWTGVEFLYQFLTNNISYGPYAEELPLEYAEPGDVIQLSFDGEIFSHSLLVVHADSLSPGRIRIATHSQDAYNRPLRTYTYELSRLLHIEGVR